MFAHDYAFKFNSTIYNKAIDLKGIDVTEADLMEATKAMEVVISYE